MRSISTGCSCIDSNLAGGISEGTITLVYGEAETGKSTFAMQCAIDCALQKKKTLYVDCDGTFSAKRLAQLAGTKFDEIAELIVLVKPIDFREQTAFIDFFTDYLVNNVGLVVFDTITSLYRAQVAETEGKTFTLNRELNRQLALIAQTVKIKKIPVLLISQVRSILNESDDAVEPVGTRVLKFWADTIIAMKPMENLQTINALIEKPKLEPEVACQLRIDLSGIHDYSFYH